MIYVNIAFKKIMKGSKNLLNKNPLDRNVKFIKYSLRW